MIKNFTRSLWIVALTALAFACSEDDPLPLPEVIFSNKIVEVGVPVMFDNKSKNADRYEWTFGDDKTSDDVSPIVTFETPGDVEVTLKAFTKDGQEASVTQTITVKQRFLVGYLVNTFPIRSYNGTGFEDWDLGEADPDDSFADIVVLLAAESDLDFENGLFEGTYANVYEPPFGRELDNSDDEIIFTDETWNFILFDNDGQDVDLVYMIGSEFNPLEIPFVQVDDESGYIPYTTSDGNSIFTFNLYYELR